MTEPRPTNPGPLIFISAAEPSADRIGAALIRAVRLQAPDARFVGVAGPRMVEAGCWSIYDMTRHSAMLLGVLGAAGRGWTLLRTCKRYLRRYRFDAAVVIDSPVLHLPLAGTLTRQGVPVLYYVAPQLWAWGAWRTDKLRRRTRKLAVILPFEEEYFRSRGFDATFVGHPMFDADERQLTPEPRLSTPEPLTPEPLTPEPRGSARADSQVRTASPTPQDHRSTPEPRGSARADSQVRTAPPTPQDHRSTPEPRGSARADSQVRTAPPVPQDHHAPLSHPLIALLPGSRKHVVREVLPGQLEVAQRIAQAIPGATFGVSVANAQVAPVISQACSQASTEVISPVSAGGPAGGNAQAAGAPAGPSSFTVQQLPGRHAELIAAADLVLVASGTTTLEVAVARKPMIVMYNTSRLMYHLLGRWLLKTPFLSLPNILAGREIVPEFMPYYRSTEPIAEKALELLQSEDQRAAMAQDLATTIAPLQTGNASQRVAEMVLWIAGGR